MERLEALWADLNDEGIPFRANVREDAVLETLRAIPIDDAVRTRTRQWMRWNRHLNAYEGEPYTTWAAGVYLRIESLLRSDETNENPKPVSEDVAHHLDRIDPDGHPRPSGD